MAPSQVPPHIPPIKSIGIDPNRHHVGGTNGYNPNPNMPMQQQQQHMFPPNQGMSSISDHEDIKNRSFRQHQKLLQSPLVSHHHLSPRPSNNRLSVQQHQHQQQLQQQQYHRHSAHTRPSPVMVPQQQQQQYPSQQQMQSNQVMHFSQNSSTNGLQQHQGQNNQMNHIPLHLDLTNNNSITSLGESQRSSHSRTRQSNMTPSHSPMRNPSAISNNSKINAVPSAEVPWATYTPQLKSPHRSTVNGPSTRSNPGNRSSMAPTMNGPQYRSPSPAPSQRISNIPNSPYLNNNNGMSHPANNRSSNRPQPHMVPMNRQQPSSPQHFSNIAPMPQRRSLEQYDSGTNSTVNYPTNRPPPHMINAPPLPYQQPPQSHHHPQPNANNPNGIPNNASSRNSMVSRTSIVNATTKDVLIYFNTNGSAKHVDHTIPGSTMGSENGNKNTSPPPRPIDGSAGSRILAFFGTTCNEFVLLFHEDDGNKSWQSKVWCNIPTGLDLKLHTLDIVHHCSFMANDWFLLTQCNQTGKYKSYWNVESSLLHSALTTYAQSNTYIRLVFGENGQYVILHGKNGYQVGPNIPTQLETALDRAFTSGNKVVGVHGINAHGRFIVHLLKNSGSHNDSLTSVDEQQPTVASFNAQGLSTQLDQVLRTANKGERLYFVLSIKDTAWIMIRDHSFERTDDLHYDLIMELDGFYARHKKRQEKRTEEIEKFYENERVRQSKKPIDIVDNHTKSDVDNAATAPDKKKVVEKAATVPEKETVARTKTNRNKSITKASLELGESTGKLKTEVKVAPPIDHNRGTDHKKSTSKKDKSKTKKELKPSMLRAQQLLAKEDRISEIFRKDIKVGDKVTVLGVSGALGDSIIKSVESIDASVVVVVPSDAGGKKKSSADKITTIRDIRRLVKYIEVDELANFGGLFQGSLPRDEYESAMELYHIHCKYGSCDCKVNFFGSTERFQQPSMWKEGDRVNVVGYTDGTVISSKPKYAGKAYLVHVQYDDGTSYHVRSDQVRPIKRYIEPGSCCFASLREHEESAVRLRPVVDETAITPFDEYKCPERIDLRKLQRLVANLRADSDLRKECMKSLVASLDADPNDVLADQCYSQLEHCYDLEETIYMMYEHVKCLPMDDNGCVTYYVQYSHKNFSCRGRLYAIGRSVLVLPGKFPRTATLQGIHAEFRAPLTGAFAHEIDCMNNDIRLLCSLAKQLALDDMIPALKDYRDNMDSWIEKIQEEHPQVHISNIKRLVSVIVCGGTYETWLQLVGEEDVIPKLKRFAFRLVSEIQALSDQLVHHPRFQWTFLERKKLESQGFKEAAIKKILCLRILHASENEVLGIIHRTFHHYGWIVRTKIFNSMVVECGPNVSKEHSALTTMMRIAERKCESVTWDIKLAEKQSFGCEEQPLHSLTEARSLMKQFLRRTNLGSQGSVEDESTSDQVFNDDDAIDHDENYDDDDDDDDLVTTLTRSVGTLSHSQCDMDEDEMFCSNLINPESYGNSFESLDLQNESTFHDDSDDEMVRSIELPVHYRVNDGNNGSKDSMGC